MNLNTANNVQFHESLDNIAGEMPYAILNKNAVHGITNRLNVWIAILGMHPGLAGMGNDMQAIHMSIAATWHDAIQRATKDCIFPHIVLEEIQYKAAMSLMHVSCEMDADIQKILQEANQTWEEVLLYKAPLYYRYSNFEAVIEDMPN